MLADGMHLFCLVQSKGRCQKTQGNPLTMFCLFMFFKGESNDHLVFIFTVPNNDVSGIQKF